MIKLFFKKYIKRCLSLLLIAISFLLFSPSSIDAKLEFSENTNGDEIQRSLETLRDLDNQTWQIVVYPQEDNNESLLLRIIGFKGSLRLDHPAKLRVKSGLKSWVLEDITLQNSQLANDNRDAAAEFLIDPLIKNLTSNRTLRLSLERGFNELPIPPYVVNEWRSVKSNSSFDENKF